MSFSRTVHTKHGRWPAQEVTMANQERRRADAEKPSTDPRMTDDAVRNRAYDIYERRGGEHGRDWDDWLQAERELNTPDEDRE